MSTASESCRTRNEPEMAGNEFWREHKLQLCGTKRNECAPLVNSTGRLPVPPVPDVILRLQSLSVQVGATVADRLMHDDGAKAPALLSPSPRRTKIFSFMLNPRSLRDGYIITDLAAANDEETMVIGVLNDHDFADVHDAASSSEVGAAWWAGQQRCTTFHFIPYNFHSCSLQRPLRLSHLHPSLTTRCSASRRRFW